MWSKLNVVAIIMFTSIAEISLLPKKPLFITSGLIKIQNSLNCFHNFSFGLHTIGFRQKIL